MSLIGALVRTVHNVACVPLDVAGDVIDAVICEQGPTSRTGDRMSKIAEDIDPRKRDVVDRVVDKINGTDQ